MTTETETEVQALRRELREVQERLASANGGGPDDSITVARREIEAQYFNPSIRSIMDEPCAHMSADGTRCGMSWKVDNDTIRPIHMPATRGGHSYRPTPLESPAEDAGAAYHLQRADRAQYGLEEPPSKAAQDIYMSEKQASALLQVTLKVLRGMVKDGAVEADKIGDVSLVRRQSVDRLLAMAEAIKDAGDEEADSDG